MWFEGEVKVGYKAGSGKNSSLYNYWLLGGGEVLVDLVRSLSPTRRPHIIICQAGHFFLIFRSGRVSITHETRREVLLKVRKSLVTNLVLRLYLPRTPARQGGGEGRGPFQ